MGRVPCFLKSCILCVRFSFFSSFLCLITASGIVFHLFFFRSHKFCCTAATVFDMFRSSALMCLPFKFLSVGNVISFVMRKKICSGMWVFTFLFFFMIFSSVDVFFGLWACLTQKESLVSPLLENVGFRVLPILLFLFSGSLWYRSLVVLCRGLGQIKRKYSVCIFFSFFGLRFSGLLPVSFYVLPVILSCKLLIFSLMI